MADDPRPWLSAAPAEPGDLAHAAPVPDPAPPAVPPVVPPADHLTGHAAGGAVQMAAVIVQPEQADEKLKRFLTLGRDIAAGRSLWN